jgi:predicted transposase YdaD
MLREGFQTDWLQESYLKGKSDGRAEGKVDGKAEGKAEEARGALIRVLTRRGLASPAHLLARIEAVSDVQRLERWLDVAITAKSISEVFSDDA